ncbi:hypothetical protein IG631_02814 [Alternaria alternata]|nr:hypothetical protein IG631_02814 [Alternaria alternata]
MHTARPLGKDRAKSDKSGRRGREGQGARKQRHVCFLSIASRQWLLDVMLWEGVLTASAYLGSDYFHDSRNGMTSRRAPLALPTRPAQKALKASNLACSEWAVNMSWLYR